MLLSKAATNPNFIATNESLAILDLIAKQSHDRNIRGAAHTRVSELIETSTDLRPLAAYGAYRPATTNNMCAWNKARSIVLAWRQQKATEKVPELLEVGNLLAFTAKPSTRVVSESSAAYEERKEARSGLSALTLSAARDILTSSYETILEDDYKRNFSLDGLALSSVVSKVKANNGKRDAESVAVSVTGDSQNPSVSVMPEKAPLSVTKETFRMRGVFYECWKYGNLGAVRETVRRESGSSGSGPTVFTEVIRLDGVLYRKSKVEGL